MTDLCQRLRSINGRLELSRLELQLQPEYFQATAELAIAGREISEILEAFAAQGVGNPQKAHPRDRRAANCATPAK